jgi:hypothetical protein
MTTITWLLALHLTVTYAPKVLEVVQGIQQIQINKQNQKLDEWMIRQVVKNQSVGPVRPTRHHARVGANAKQR